MAKKTKTSTSPVTPTTPAEELIELLKADVAETAATREAEKHARINEINLRYASAIDAMMVAIISAGATSPADLSNTMATKLARDFLKEFKFPAFEELLSDGTPRLRPAGDRLDGLRTTDDPTISTIYRARSVAWRIVKILGMLRQKTIIPSYTWEDGLRASLRTWGEVIETIGDTANISFIPKRGRPSAAAKKLAAAKAKQGGGV